MKAHEATGITARTSFVQVLKLSLPLAAVQLGNQALGAVDTAFAGRISPVALSATGIGSSIFFAVVGLGLGLGIALDPLIAQAFGANRREEGRHSLWVGIVVLLLISLPLSAVIALFAWKLEAMGIGSEIAVQVRAYMWARLPSLAPLLLSIAIRSWLQADRITRPILIAAVATNIINAIADYVLIYGDAALGPWSFLPFAIEPQGVAGIGWASTVSSTGQLLVMLLFCKNILPPRFDEFKRVAWRILKLGIPISLHIGVEIAIFSAMHVIAGRMGKIPSAAHQTALVIASGSFSMCLGIGAASCVEVGRALGKQSQKEVRHAGFAGMGLGAALMLSIAVFMWVMPEKLAAVFTNDPRVIQLAAQLLRIAGVFQLVDGLQTVATGALRGLGDSRFAFLVNLGAHWGLGLPFGLWLAYPVGMGVAGLWWGVTLSLTLVAIALVWRFRQLARRTCSTIP